jgi:bifunctional DNA-binding transcriptional regulator/antitoxin component of YhaV-PrlF toxin-antitoxin module
MYIEDNFIHTSVLKIDEEGRIKIPEDVLNTLGITTDTKIRLIATTEYLVFEPQIKPVLTYADMIRKFQEKRK